MQLIFLGQSEQFYIWDISKIKQFAKKSNILIASANVISRKKKEKQTQTVAASELSKQPKTHSRDYDTGKFNRYLSKRSLEKKGKEIK